MITLEKILGALTGKENLYRSGRNFTALETEVNAHGTQIKDLYDQINGTGYQSGAQDANTYINTGVYTFGALSGHSNFPPSINAGALIVNDCGDYKTQSFVSSLNKMYYRIFNGLSWTSWQEVVTEVEPTIYSIPFETGYKSVYSYVSKYRKKNSMVSFDIQCQKTDGTSLTKGTWITIATLPVGFRPTIDLNFVIFCANNTYPCVLSVLTTGQIRYLISSTLVSTDITVINGVITFYVGGGTV